MRPQIMFPLLRTGTSILDAPVSLVKGATFRKPWTTKDTKAHEGRRWSVYSQSVNRTGI